MESLAEKVIIKGKTNSQLLLFLTLYYKCRKNRSWSAISLVVSNWFNQTGDYPNYKTLRPFLALINFFAAPLPYKV